MKNRVASIIATACFFVPCHVFAEPTSTEKYSDSELVQILKDEGYSSVEALASLGVLVKIDGNAYLLVNLPSGDLQAYYVVTGANVSHADMNEWNRTKRLSRAYLDSDEDPVLESDLLANAGLTESHVTEFFRVFKDSAAIFRDFIIEHHDN